MQSINSFLWQSISGCESKIEELKKGWRWRMGENMLEHQRGAFWEWRWAMAGLGASFCESSEEHEATTHTADAGASSFSSCIFFFFFFRQPDCSSHPSNCEQVASSQVHKDFSSCELLVLLLCCCSSSSELFSAYARLFFTPSVLTGECLKAYLQIRPPL